MYHQLHWVHGYSCRLTRGAVRYTSEGNIVYPAASLAVTLDKNQRQQLHTMAHRYTHLDHRLC